MNMLAEMMGYLASVMLAISLMVTKELRFRIINSLGCLFFVVYGLMINAWPIVVTNMLLLCINLFYLYKISLRKEDFELVVLHNKSDLLKKFFSFYKDDFQSYYPAFDYAKQDANVQFVVLRDMAIANVFLANKDANGNAEVLVNYTIPKYRDYKVGKFLFNSNVDELRTLGIKRIHYQNVHNPGHETFLNRLGFTKLNGDKEYELAL